MYINVYTVRLNYIPMPGNYNDECTCTIQLILIKQPCMVNVCMVDYNY